MCVREGERKCVCVCVCVCVLASLVRYVLSALSLQLTEQYKKLLLEKQNLVISPPKHPVTIDLICLKAYVCIVCVCRALESRQ